MATLFFANPYKKIGIFSSHRALVRANNKQRLIIDYFLPETRELIYRNAGSLLEEIVLRNGGELGCRTKENQGFLLKDIEVNKKRFPGMLTLFLELETKPNKIEFKYYLPSLYTKYGRSRILYIPRYLLERMKNYYELERPESDSNHLLVSSSRNNSRGQCISHEYGSKTFCQVWRQLRDNRKKHPELYTHVQHFDEAYVYHILRHSFGTDIFYEMCKAQNKQPDSITTESAVYIETARRMGHKVEGYYSNTTTKKYIHSCGYRDKLIKETLNGYS